MSAVSYSNYEYMDENIIDDELKCVICQQPLESPVSLSICNHTFCKDCIKTWLSRNQTCPTCRQVITRHCGRNNMQSFRTPTYVPINTRIVLNQLDRLLIRCLLCNETNIQRCHWNNHEKTCLKKTVSCPSADIKCTWEGSRDTLSIHLKTCPFQQVRPIIDELKNELTSIQTTQIQLKNSVNILERKVAFLLQFINNGNIMTQNRIKSANECTNDGSNRNFRFVCSICRKYIPRDQISLHACSGNCICRSCVNSQYLELLQTWEPSNDEDLLENSEEID